VATTSPIATGARPVWRRYLELTKPRVVALITFTAIVGTLLATPGLPPLDALIFGNLGIVLFVDAGNVWANAWDIRPGNLLYDAAH
jgi:protoheme IX farnesyltransferase